MIEVNRRLYMDETTALKSERFGQIQLDISEALRDAKDRINIATRTKMTAKIKTGSGVICTVKNRICPKAPELAVFLQLQTVCRQTHPPKPLVVSRNPNHSELRGRGDLRPAALSVPETGVD
jgi:hypothetical protein